MLPAPPSRDGQKLPFDRHVFDQQRCQNKTGDGNPDDGREHGQKIQRPVLVERRDDSDCDPTCQRDKKRLEPQNSRGGKALRNQRVHVPCLGLDGRPQVKLHQAFQIEQVLHRDRLIQVVLGPHVFHDFFRKHFGVRRERVARNQVHDHKRHRDNDPQRNQHEKATLDRIMKHVVSSFVQL